MTPEELDRQIRIAAFSWLGDLRVQFGDNALPWSVLAKGFRFGDQLIPVVGQTGIFKPAALPRLPISILTSIDGPYDDQLLDDGLIRYRARGTNPNQWNNQRLREAMVARVPLIYFYGVVSGRYIATYPVYVVGEDTHSLTYFVEAESQDDIARYASGSLPDHDTGRTALVRRYATVAATKRLHQQAFRERVLTAYKTHCALCRLRHESLLDAAHIISDRDNGPAEVRNGIALCKIHHAAYDRNFLAIRPDFTVDVRKSLLEENDGPMLQHGLKEMHNMKILLPNKQEDKPDTTFLEVRYKQFLTTVTLV